MTTALADRICARLRGDLQPETARVRLVPFAVDGHAVGRMTVERTQRLAQFSDVFRLTADALVLRTSLQTEVERTARLGEVTRILASEGALTAWRDELYPVAPSLGAPTWFRLERAAARYFGIRTHAAHVNGLVRDAAATTMWVARRSPRKPIDPGMLDNLVGGGIAAGVTVAQTVVKEAWEEAGIAASVAAQALLTCTLHVARLLPDGLQDETLHVHDLWLPPDFGPTNQDGEVVAHRRMSLMEVARVICESDGPDAMTVDASLVALTALVREGCFDGERSSGAALVTFLQETAALRANVP